MAGVEVHEHLRPVIESIERVERLFTCPIAEVPGQFPLIGLIHVLEHIASPRNFLTQIKNRLEPGGLLLIQVPDCEQNPFMLLVADHASHFFLPVLERLVESAGYEVVLGAKDWVAKELTVVARKAGSDSRSSHLPVTGSEGISGLKQRLEWLKRLEENARQVSKQRPFGLLAFWRTQQRGGFLCR